jgi:Na+-driven multidrug efflux pump
MLVPASCIVIGEGCHLVLSPALIPGGGPFPPLGIVGAAVGALSACAIGATTIGSYLCSHQHNGRRDTGHPQDQSSGGGKRSVFWSINFFTTGLLGQLASAPIVGYGIATRLDTIQYPIIFAFGSSVMAMVTTAIGASDRSRAARVGRTECGVAAMIALPFTMIAIFRQTWMKLFTSDVTIQATGALYLTCQAPVFPLLSAGIAAVWACYGAWVVRPPLVQLHEAHHRGRWLMDRACLVRTRAARVSCGGCWWQRI